MSRKGCCLCEDAEAAALQAQEKGLCRIEVIDVDTDLELAARYGMDVPVLLVDGVEMLKHEIRPEQLEALLTTR